MSVTQKAVTVRDQRRTSRRYGFQFFSATSAIQPVTSLKDLSNTEKAMGCSQIVNCRNSVQDYPSFYFSAIHSSQVIFLHLNHSISTWTNGWSFSRFSCYLLKLSVGQLGHVLNSWQQTYTWNHTWHVLQMTQALWAWSSAWYCWAFLVFIRGCSTKTEYFVGI